MRLTMVKETTEAIQIHQERVWILSVFWESLYFVTFLDYSSQINCDIVILYHVF